MKKYSGSLGRKARSGNYRTPGNWKRLSSLGSAAKDDALSCVECRTQDGAVGLRFYGHSFAGLSRADWFRWSLDDFPHTQMGHSELS